MHTVDKGEISRYLAVAHFTELGWRTSIPITENSPYDLIVECEEKLNRVQIKTAQIKNNAIEIRLTSSNAKYSKKYSSEEIDWLVGVDIQNKKYYRVIYKPGIFDKRRQISLRLFPAKNNRTKNINWAKDFEI